MARQTRKPVPPLGEQLRAAREAARLSLAETVSLVRHGPVPSVLYHLERGRGRLVVLCKVAKALGRDLRLPSVTRLREERGLTRQELAELANIHPGTLRKMERDPTDALVDRAESVYRALGEPLKLTA